MTFFFYGPNTYLLRRQIDQMAAAYLKKTGSDMGLEKIDGTSASTSDIRAALQAVPFLATSRLVIITGLSGNKAVFEKLGNPLALVPDTTVAVFAETGIDQRTSAFKVLGGADKVVKFEPQTSAQLSLWARKQIEEAGGTAGHGAVAELLRQAGEDQWRLSEEIAKLVAYDKTVTPETVRLLVIPSAEASIFELVEAATAGRANDALAARERLAGGKQDDIYVLSMIQWQLRNLLLAKTAPAGMTQAQLAKTAGMSPYVAGKMLAASKRHKETALRSGFAESIDCERDIKTGRRKAEVAVEQLIFRLSELAES